MNMQMRVNRSTIELIRGDITTLPVDAVVNAANEMLRHGGGVAGAIVRAGGRIIQEESTAWVRRHRPVRTGSAAITTAGSLPARYVIHAVGPIMGSGDEEVKLRSATLSALKLADEHHLRSIAFPAISTGIFGYPAPRCAGVMLPCVRDYLSATTGLEKVIFCLWDLDTLTIFREVLTGMKSAD